MLCLHSETSFKSSKTLDCLNLTKLSVKLIWAPVSSCLNFTLFCLGISLSVSESPKYWNQRHEISDAWINTLRLHHLAMFLVKKSLCSSCWPWTSDLPTSSSQLLGLKVCSSLAWHKIWSMPSDLSEATIPGKFWFQNIISPPRHIPGIRGGTVLLSLLKTLKNSSQT